MTQWSAQPKDNTNALHYINTCEARSLDRCCGKITTSTQTSRMLELAAKWVCSCYGVEDLHFNDLFLASCIRILSYFTTCDPVDSRLSIEKIIIRT